MIDRGDRVLPDQYLAGHERAEISMSRPHVAVRELEPRARKRICKLIRMLVEAPRYLLVDGVETRGEVGRQHGGETFLRWVEGTGDRRLGPLPLPLPGARRA